MSKRLRLEDVTAGISIFQVRYFFVQSNRKSIRSEI